ncbi:DUF3378 domain-containing protein, partial [Bacillus pumilus]|uniref:DUF3378 domain-containing protein n=1 Tax=Bacillus pumilus TaxID=1408 RepID=UPI001C92C97C
YPHHLTHTLPPPPLFQPNLPPSTITPYPSPKLLFQGQNPQPQPTQFTYLQPPHPKTSKPPPLTKYTPPSPIPSISLIPS